MPKCTILVGVPGSGKSTWLSRNYLNMISGSVVISTDDIITSIARIAGFTYNDIFSDAITLAEKIMWKQLRHAAEDGRDIYIDRTNMTVNSRKKFIDYLKPYGYTFDCVVFGVPEGEEWQRRLDSRPGKTIPQEAIDRMINSFEMPTEAEGFKNVIPVV